MDITFFFFVYKSINFHYLGDVLYYSSVGVSSKFVSSDCVIYAENIYFMYILTLEGLHFIAL
jgi:hypothetical protein